MHQVHFCLSCDVLENGCVYDSSLCPRLPIHKSESQKVSSSQLMCLFTYACAKTQITGFLNPLNQAADLISFLRNSMNSAVSCCKSFCPSTCVQISICTSLACPLTPFQYNSDAAKSKISETACGFRRNNV